MKKLPVIITVSALLVSSAASAGTLTSDDIKTCKGYQDLAHQIMKARQIGVPMSKVAQVVADDPIGVDLMNQAYSTPRYSTQGYKDRAAGELANQTFLNCTKALSEAHGSRT